MSNGNHHWEQQLSAAPTKTGFTQQLAYKIEQQANTPRRLGRKIAPWIGGLVAAAVVLLMVTTPLSSLLQSWLGHAPSTTTATQNRYFADPKKNLEYLIHLAPNQYNTVKGTATFQDGSTMVFQVQEGDHPASYAKTIGANGSISEYRYDGTYYLHLLDGNIFQANRSQTAPRLTKDPNDIVLYQNTPVPQAPFYNAYVDPANSGIAGQVTAPGNGVLPFLYDTTTWHIDGTTTMLGRTVYVVRGDMPKITQYQMDDKIKSYKYWIDQETGMLFKYEYLLADGKTVHDSLEVTSIEVNQPLDEHRFELTKAQIEAANQQKR